MKTKFRAWDKKEKEMVVVWGLDFLSGEVSTYKNITNGVIVDPHSHEEDDVIVMQSTGLKDKNGVEIYEGDIVFHPLQGRRKVYYPYSENVASYGLRDIDSGFGSTLQDGHAVWEVIGNIWEDGDLLEVEG